MGFKRTSMEIVMKGGVAGTTKSVFGLYRDTSDGQWNAYSANIGILMVCIFVYLALSHFLRSQKWV